MQKRNESTGLPSGSNINPFASGARFDPDNIERQTSTNPTGDIIFVPVNNLGSPGPLNTQVLELLGINRSAIPVRDGLSDGYALISAGIQQICFVVTVGEGRTADLLARNLGKALADSRLSDAKSLWIPLMGTGAGNLSLAKSEEIIVDVLVDTQWYSRSDVRIVLAFPPSASPLPPPASELAPLPLSAAVAGALEFAKILMDGRRERGDQISTTLLFFALAESQVEAAPRDLTADNKASLFSGAVHSLAGYRFREAWDHYFISGYTLTSSSAPTRSTGSTNNAKTILQRAEVRARDAGRNSVEIDDLVESLLRFPDGRHHRVINAMGLSAEELLDAYRDALTGQIGTTLLNDVASETDRLVQHPVNRLNN